MVVVVRGVSRVAFWTPFSAACRHWYIGVLAVTVPVDGVVERYAALLAALRERRVSALLATALHSTIQPLVAKVKSALEILVAVRIELLSDDNVKHRDQFAKFDRILRVVALGKRFNDRRKNSSCKIFFLLLLFLRLGVLFSILKQLFEEVNFEIWIVRVFLGIPKVRNEFVIPKVRNEFVIGSVENSVACGIGH